MILAIVLLIILWFRPRWDLLAAYCAGLAILNTIFGYLRYAAFPELEGAGPLIVLLAALIDVVIVVAVFAALGAAIVFVRSRSDRKKEAELDAELARVRAEIAARDGAARSNDPPA